MTFEIALGMFAISFVGAVVALAAVGMLIRRAGLPHGSVFSDRQGGIVFLFDGETLVDATEAGRALLAASRTRGSDWQRLVAFAASRFPDFENKINRLPDAGQIRLAASDHEGMSLLAEWRGGLRRIMLSEAHEHGGASLLDSLSQRAQEDELDALRQTLDLAPYPIWREDADSGVVWANAAYAELAGKVLDAPALDLWPLPALFAEDTETTGRQRIEIADQPQWFDLERRGFGRETLNYALPADAAVRAEQSLGEFLQILTRTFAHLPIGLAIFDRQRRLQLFNPALTDLSTLPADFLSARPTLYALLDAMRERRMTPEPRDFKEWRARLSKVDGAGDAPDFAETWSLAGGVTYRVVARPHPEGALALLIEDISDQMARTRSHHADLALGQSVIDAMAEAVAVFAADGALVMANAAHAALWGEAAEGVALSRIRELAALWRGRSAPSPIWERAEGFIVEGGERIAWQDTARLTDGRALRCRFVPLAGGATLAGFIAEPMAEMRATGGVDVARRPHPVGHPRGISGPERIVGPL